MSIINLGDVYSRMKIDSLPCLKASHPSIEDYQLILRQALVTMGLPERISLDHDSAFYDNRCPSLSLPRRLEWEEMLDMKRVDAYLTAGRWFRKTPKGR